MSSLPPNVIASSLQTVVQQRQAGQVRATGERRQSDMSQLIARAAEQHENQIENTDADSRVHADGGGGGGQGRAFSERPQPGLTDEQKKKDPGVTTDDEGRMHLDVTA